MPSLLERLKERKLVQWALAYLAGAYLVYEASWTAAEAWGLSVTLVRGTHVVLIFGLFVTIVLAWYHGEKGRQRVSGPELLMVAALLVIAGAVLSMLGPYEEASSPTLTVEDPFSEDERPSVAALPFVNLGASGEHAYFADGVHDQILTQLSKIGSLRVISRTSVMQYRAEDGSISGTIPVIAAALGVEHVLEGSLQRDADRIRLTVQLIDADTDEHLWAESYDRRLEDIFAVQSELASRVASALDATLGPEEAGRIAARPTANVEAYSFLLRGDDYFRRAQAYRRYDSIDVALATEQYERAIALDPEYALPHARLSTLHTELYWWTADRTPARAQQAEASARRALELDPDSPEAHAALGRFFYRHRRFAEALAEYATWEELRPGDADAAFWVGMVLRRLNRWDESLERQRRAQALDPLDPLKLTELYTTFRRMRLWDEALRLNRRWAELYPDERAGAIEREVATRLEGFGDLETARSLLAAELARTDTAGAPVGMWLWLESWQGDHEAALAWASRLRGGWAVVDRASHAGEVRGTVLKQLGRTAEAHEAFESARTFLESELSARPSDRRLHSALGRVYGQLGRKAEAIAAVQRGLDLSPISVDPLDGSHALYDAALVYTVTGEHDAAVEVLDQLLSLPHAIFIHELRLAPEWAPLSERPDFQALLAKYGSTAQ